MVSTCPPDVVWPDMKYTVEWDWEASLKRGEAGVHEPETPQSSSLIRSVRLSPGEDSRDTLSETHHFLMLPVMPAFALRTKTWSRFDSSSDVPGARGLGNFADR